MAPPTFVAALGFRGHAQHGAERRNRDPMGFSRLGASIAFGVLLARAAWRHERLFACTTRAPRDTSALGDHGSRTALGCRCRGADCALRSSIIPTTAQARGAGASELDKHSVPALVGCRGSAAAGRCRGCDAETGVRALPRCRAGVPHPADVAGSRGTGAAAVVRCGTGPTDRTRWLPPLSGFSWAALPPCHA